MANTPHKLHCRFLIHNSLIIEFMTIFFQTRRSFYQDLVKFLSNVMQVMCMYGMIRFAMDEMIVLMVKMKNNAILVRFFYWNVTGYMKAQNVSFTSLWCLQMATTC